MREFAVVIAVASLVGCGDSSAEEPDWSVALEQFAVDGWVLANSAAMRASDGSFVVAVHAPHLRVRIGEQQLQGSQVARISADGAVLGIAAAPEADVLSGGRTKVRTDELGNTVVLWGEALTLASYDAALNRNWAQPFDTKWSTLLDVSAQGAIAIVSTDALASTATLQVLHPDGTMAWEATHPQILAIRFAANGDLFAIGAGHRWRYDSTGNIVEDIAVASGATLAAADGGWFYAKPMKESSELDHYDSMGQFAWSQTYPYELYVDDIVVSNAGSILVRADVMTRSPVLLEIAPLTGEDNTVNSGCVMSTLIAADAEHCYGIAIEGLSQFALH